MLKAKHFNETYEPERIAAAYDVKVNPNSEHVVSILTKLGSNQVQFGAPYCPCQAKHTDDTICPCKYLRQHKACRCGMYVNA